MIFKTRILLVAICVIGFVFIFIRFMVRSTGIRGEESFGSLTVVLSVTSENQSPKIITEFERYPFITELIVHNSGLMPINDLHSDRFSIRVVNSPSSGRDLARFSACSMARNDYCYYQDAEWSNVFINSLWSTFKRNPTVTHAFSPPGVLYETKQRSFYNRIFKLHTEFSWLGYGSIFSRASVIQFLAHMTNKLDKINPEMCFTLWNNEFPIKLANSMKLQSFDVSVPEQIQDGESVDEYLTKCLEVIYNDLKDGSGMFKSGDILPPLAARDARSACFDDRCVFITNIDAYMSPTIHNFQMKNLKRHAKRFNSQNFPAKEWSLNWGFQNAVDRDENTCWRSSWNKKVLTRDSYFGLDLLKSDHWKSISYRFGEYTLLNLFDVKVSLDGNVWIPAIFDRKKAIESDKITFDWSRDDTHPFRYIRFHLASTEDRVIPLTICHLSLDSS